MTYELQAVVAGASLIEEMAGRFLHATTVPLNRGLALIPVSGRTLGQRYTRLDILRSGVTRTSQL